ncbi:cupredoxin family copper-binding protein [Candidatus Daviesbacteria bacterium]|nr:cupredoxin family copper-binding protein [Candidatus Daviesbacteria bacterium]
MVLLLGGYIYTQRGAKYQAPSPVTSPEINSAEEATSEASSNQEGSEVMVEISNFTFVPKTITVKVGTTVTFTNKDSVGHSATADDGSFDTGVLSQNESGSVTFSKAGTFAYHCTPHPNMQATVVVEE